MCALLAVKESPQTSMKNPAAMTVVPNLTTPAGTRERLLLLMQLRVSLFSGIASPSRSWYGVRALPPAAWLNGERVVTESLGELQSAGSAVIAFSKKSLLSPTARAFFSIMPGLNRVLLGEQR